MNGESDEEPEESNYPEMKFEKRHPEISGLLAIDDIISNLKNQGYWIWEELEECGDLKAILFEQPTNIQNLKKLQKNP